MTKNVCGSSEKTIRVIIGLLILGVGWFYDSYWGLIGLVPIVTAAVGWCPLSYIFGVKSCKIKSTNISA